MPLGLEEDIFLRRGGGSSNNTLDAEEEAIAELALQEVGDWPSVEAKGREVWPEEAFSAEILVLSVGEGVCSAFGEELSKQLKTKHSVYTYAWDDRAHDPVFVRAAAKVYFARARPDATVLVLGELRPAMRRNTRGKPGTVRGLATRVCGGKFMQGIEFLEPGNVVTGAVAVWLEAAEAARRAACAWMAPREVVAGPETCSAFLQAAVGAMGIEEPEVVEELKRGFPEWSSAALRLDTRVARRREPVGMFM